MSAPSEEQINTFLDAQIARVEKQLKARNQEASAWKTGTDDLWRKAGCNLNKKQRLELAETHEAIAKKISRELELFRAAKAALTAAQAQRGGAE